MKVISEAGRQNSEHCLTDIKAEYKLEGARFWFSMRENFCVREWQEEPLVGRFRLL